MSLNKLKTHDIHVTINRLVIAVLCMFTLLSDMTSILNISIYVIVGIMIGLLLISFTFYRRFALSDISAIIVLLILVLFLYVFSKLSNNIGDISPISLIGFCFFPIFCSVLEKNVKLILEVIMFISLLALPFADQLFAFQFESLQQTNMSVAYAFFVSVSAAFIHFFWYRKGSNILIILCYLVNIYWMYKIIMVGNRGVIVSFLFLIMVLMLRYTKKRDVSDKKKKIMTSLLWIFGILIIIIVLNFDNIIIYLYDYFKSRNEAMPSFIIKMYRLIVYKSDISNGRDDLYPFFLNKIMNSPVWGYGMEMSSEVSYGLFPYPHNYILQMLFEGGIIFALFPIVVSVYMVVDTLFKNNDKLEYEVFSVFLLCNCIPKLMISGNIWNQPILWIWLGVGAVRFNKWRKQKWRTKLRI